MCTVALFESLNQLLAASGNALGSHGRPIPRSLGSPKWQFEFSVASDRNAHTATPGPKWQLHFHAHPRVKLMLGRETRQRQGIGAVAERCDLLSASLMFNLYFASLSN